MHNCLSRDKGADVYVCVACGADEAVRDCEPEKKMRLSEWAAVRTELQGKTFLDLLRSNQELDCDLIIGGAEMPATFVWDGESPLTEFGTIFYAELLESPYKIFPHGNIEVFCDNEKLGEHFTLASAGHIGIKEYRKLFGHMELTREDMVIDRELIVEGETVTAYIETWFDVCEKFGIEAPDNNDMSVNFYAVYRPEMKNLRCFYVVKEAEPDKDTDFEYYPIPSEVELITSMMEETCKEENKCTLMELVSDEAEQASMPEWVVTDDSCWQCCREISGKVFELIQICDLGESYDVSRGTINLDDYEVGVWEDYINLFQHDGINGFINDYDKTFPMRILAEYIFETDWENYLQSEDFSKFNDAARYIAGIVDCEIDLE
jgi:hypothetical protein